MRSDKFDPQTQVFDFTHIPKCGGTTVHRFLEELMDGNYVHCLPDSGWQEKMPHMWGAGGHQLRDQNPISRKPKEIVRLIIMREPLQRFISFYKHILDHPDHYLSIRPEVKGASALQFAQYCESVDITEFSNLQARFIAGPRGDMHDLPFLLETLKTEFDFIVPLHMLSTLRPSLAQFFGKPAPELVSHNVSKPFILAPAEMVAVAEIVYRNNFYDLQLYQACVDKFVADFVSNTATTS